MIDSHNRQEHGQEDGASATAFHLPSSRLAQALQAMAREAPVSFHVTGQCMEPIISEEAEVVVSARRWYWPGDIVAFHSTVGELRVHRLIGYYLRRGRLLLQMRADASGTVDQPIALDRVIGQVTGTPSPLRITPTTRLSALTSYCRLRLGKLLRR